jgi:hypothetical protein
MTSLEIFAWRLIGDALANHPLQGGEWIKERSGQQEQRLWYLVGTPAP